MPRQKYDWESLSDEHLLERRLNSLRVAVERTWLEDWLHKLHEELEERGVRLRPHAWISSEWFSPDGVPGLAARPDTTAARDARRARDCAAPGTGRPACRRKPPPARLTGRDQRVILRKTLRGGGPLGNLSLCKWTAPG